jgi:CoA-transferase family III
VGMTTTAQAMLDEAWTLLGGDPALARRVQWIGPEGLLPSALPVHDFARATVAAVGLAASELVGLRDVTVHGGAVAAAFGSERHLRINGERWLGFAPLSRFWDVADGRIRTHGNYPHHRAALLAALGVDAESDDGDVVETVAGVLAECRMFEVVERITKAGGLAVPVHTPEEWSRHEQGAAVARLPLLGLRRVTDSGRPGTRTDAHLVLPAAGLRVLDLTRVISGPVATRTLAHLGADVLRIDSPRLPEIREQHLDTGFGKRSALLDLETRTDRERLGELIDAADVVVTGYRPGALDRYGLDASALLERRPALTVARLSAWGDAGPWSHRRGFDSLVQAASGIAMLEAKADGRPGALPVQALDHGTGYLLAAAVLRAQTQREAEGGGWIAELSLAQTAAWLLRHSTTTERAPHDYDLSECLAEVDTAQGRIRYALPPVMMDGLPRDWREPARPWGGDAPSW